MILADREFVEQQAENFIESARTSDIAFLGMIFYYSCVFNNLSFFKILVVGDPFGATTHTDLVLRAKEANVPYQVVHNASILNAVGCSGLQVI